MLKKPPNRVSFREREEIIDLPNLIEIQIGDLREKKVDKETFLLINENLNALRSDIRDIKNSLIDHISKETR